MVVDIHALDQSLADHVPVLDRVLGDRAPRAVAHHLMDRHDYLTVGSLLYLPRLDERVDQVKLSPPIVTDLMVAVQASALHPVRPIYVRVHRRERTVDVTRIECLIGAAQQPLVGVVHDAGTRAVTAHTRCGIVSGSSGNRSASITVSSREHASTPASSSVPAIGPLARIRPTHASCE